MEHVRVYHGTTNVGLAVAEERGELRPLDPWQVCEHVADSVGLDPETLYRHQGFAFSRGRRNDPQIYLSACLRTATHYATIGGETLWDALRTAFWIQNRPPGNMSSAAGGRWRERQTGFCSDWLDRNGIVPVVLELDLPLVAIPVPEHSRVQDPAAWWRLVNRGGPLGNLALDAPLPLAWLAGTRGLAYAVA